VENVVNAKLLFHEGREIAVPYARLSCIQIFRSAGDLVRIKVSLD
jgi:hypothetical protein